MASSGKNTFHPALAVSNIRNSIPMMLETENVRYATWAELFRIHATSHRVLYHLIDPPSDKKIDEPITDDEKELWTTLDATVLGWIYATILQELLNTILEPGLTAKAVWGRLREIFEGNENSRAVKLEQEFSTTMMEDFPSASSYCQRLKELADQLKNADAPVSNSRLVLRIVAGLTEAFNGVGTIIRQSSPIPSFFKARSMITLEETALKKKAKEAASALLVRGNPTVSYPTNSSNSGNNGKGKGQSKNNGKNKNKGDTGKNGRNANGGSGSVGFQHTWNPWHGPGPQWGWGMPPCPYPSVPQWAGQQNWPRPNSFAGGGRAQGPGSASLLGPRQNTSQQQQAAFMGQTGQT